MLYLAVVLLVASSFAVSAAEMTFELKGNGGNCIGCEWVAADGEIVQDTYKRFVDFSKKSEISEIKLKPRIVLNSPGGSLVGGLLLGEAIRKAKFDTSVGKTVRDDYQFYTIQAGKCLSACAFSFMGGINRELEFTSKIGVHQFYDADALLRPGEKIYTATDASNNQIIIGLILEYIVRMGVDAKILALASKTLPQEIRFIDEPEASNLNLVWDSSRIDNWKIEPFKKGVVAFAESQDKLSTLTYYCSGNMRFLLYSTSKDADISQTSGEIDVMGVKVQRQSIRISKLQNGKTQIRFPLPANFTPKAESSAGLLSNFDSSSSAERFILSFGTRRIFETTRIANKNCI